MIPGSEEKYPSGQIKQDEAFDSIEREKKVIIYNSENLNLSIFELNVNNYSDQSADQYFRIYLS